MMLSNYADSHEGGCEFVRDVALSMGVVDITPPRRPGHNDAGYYIDSARDAFYMDFENECLASYAGEPPTGPRRWQHPAWGAHIKANVFPYHSDIDWLEYVEWVSAGCGDEWFQFENSGEEK